MNSLSFAFVVLGAVVVVLAAPAADQTLHVMDANNVIMAEMDRLHRAKKATGVNLSFLIIFVFNLLYFITFCFRLMKSQHQAVTPPSFNQATLLKAIPPPATRRLQAVIRHPAPLIMRQPHQATLPSHHTHHQLLLPTLHQPHPTVPTVHPLHHPITQHQLSPATRLLQLLATPHQLHLVTRPQPLRATRLRLLQATLHHLSQATLHQATLLLLHPATPHQPLQATLLLPHLAMVDTANPWMATP